MSVEEEIELRDLLAQTLETNGCLAKIRAELRASIFLALDEDVKISAQQPLLNNKVKSCLETEDGKVMFCVVREFLEFFNLYFTLSVYDPESYVGSGYKYEGREKLAKNLGLEDTADPLLLQLIKIAQAKTKSIKINLNMNNDDIEDNKSVTLLDNSISNMNKTDSDNNCIGEINVNESSDKLLLGNYMPVSEKLNVTFDLSSPTVNLNVVKKNENDSKEVPLDEACKDKLSDTIYNKKDKDDDTYGDTSSITEDSVALVNLEHNFTVPELNNMSVLELNSAPIPEFKNVSIPDLMFNGTNENILQNEADISQPVLKESKVSDKSKMSYQKNEKLKTKNSLSALSDLPPLQMNKPRVNDILPSLYSKEFKDKSNLRELDKLFDMEAEYEEDFICSGDDLSYKSDYMKTDKSKSTISDDLQQSVNSDKSASSKIDSKQKGCKSISDSNIPILKPLVNSSKTDTVRKIDSANENRCIPEILPINSSDK